MASEHKPDLSGQSMKLNRAFTMGRPNTAAYLRLFTKGYPFIHHTFVAHLPAETSVALVIEVVNCFVDTLRWECDRN